MFLGRFREKYVSAAKEAKDSCKKVILRDSFENMDHDTLDAMQAALRFLDATNELIENQTRAIDEMNEKLDKLLAK